MDAPFESFYENKTYRQYKKYLFNYRLRRRKIEPFLRRAHGPILDIGCGIAPMVSNGPLTILGDASFGAMRSMRSDGYRTVVLDVRELGVRPNSLQTIVCSEVLEHVDEDRRALEEIYRVLRPGGRLILTVPLHDYYWHRDDQVVGHHRRYDHGALIRDLRTIGFDIVRTARVGSLFERYLTLATVLVFLKADRSPPRLDGPLMGLFALANEVAARLLGAAAAITPPALCSIELLDCRKSGLADG
jgi:SAM-dependent methyltransferase